MSYFISSDEFLVSRQNLFEFESFSNYQIIQNYFDRQDTYKTNIIKQNDTSYVERERIQFPKGKQKEFIKYAKEKAQISLSKKTKPFEINYWTLQNYYKEKVRLSQSNFLKICKYVDENPKKLLNKFLGKKVIWKNELAFKNSSVLGKKKIKSQPKNIIYTKNDLSLKELNSNSKNNQFFPKKLTPLLAYEIGTSLGDGCLPKRGKSYRLKGNKNDEKEYYNKTIKPMFKELYNIDVNLKEYTNAYGFECYSKQLVKFKNEIIGLPIGTKKEICIPNVLKVNNADILGDLLSGLFDTDGSIYFKSQNKNMAYYPTVSLSTVSKRLFEDVSEILKMLGFNVCIYTNNKITKRTPNPRFEVILYGYENFKLYLKIIKTKQPKNIDKINKWRKKWPNLG